MNFRMNRIILQTIYINIETIKTTKSNEKLASHMTLIHDTIILI